MLERDRLESKKISKTNAVTSMLDYDLGAKNVHVGPSDYVPWLTDRKWAYIRMEGSSFGDVPLNVELKLEVWDSPNSAGIVIDAVRLAKLALNNGIAGSLVEPSSYLMKSPPVQIEDDEAHELTEQFIERNHRRAPVDAAAAWTPVVLLFVYGPLGFALLVLFGLAALAFYFRVWRRLPFIALGLDGGALFVGWLALAFAGCGTPAGQVDDWMWAAGGAVAFVAAFWSLSEPDRAWWGLPSSTLFGAALTVALAVVVNGNTGLCLD
jgi:hypothetical protein